MIGCYNRVAARLKRSAPSAMCVHCAAHRLILVSSQAGDVVPYVKKFNNILWQLFEIALFALQVQTIEKLAHEIGKLLVPCSTRWLSTERNVNRLKSCFVSEFRERRRTVRC